MLNFKVFGDGLIILYRLMSSNNCLSEYMADVFASWHDGDTLLSVPEHQTDTCSAFIEVLKLLDDELFHYKHPTPSLSLND